MYVEISEILEKLKINWTFKSKINIIIEQV